MKINKELLKGSTTMLVLTLLKKRPMYGYEIIKNMELKSKGIFSFKEGTLYPILHSLESDNFITSYWDNTGAKKRKYYSITNEGKKQLKEKKEEWKTFSSGVNQVIGGVLFGY